MNEGAPTGQDTPPDFTEILAHQLGIKFHFPELHESIMRDYRLISEGLNPENILTKYYQGWTVDNIRQLLAALS